MKNPQSASIIIDTSKAMKDKLAEEILEKNISIRGLLDFGNYSCVGIPYEDALKAMQAYHEAKMREEKTIISFITKLIKNESIPII